MTTPQSRSQSLQAGPPLWWAVLLNLLLPGSGFTVLGRPWWHLGTMLLTGASWVLAQFFQHAWIFSPDAAASSFTFHFQGWGLAAFLAPYPGLVVGSVLGYRRADLYRRELDAAQQWRFIGPQLALVGVFWLNWLLAELLGCRCP